MHTRWRTRLYHQGVCASAYSELRERCVAKERRLLRRPAQTDAVLAVEHVRELAVVLSHGLVCRLELLGGGGELALELADRLLARMKSSRKCTQLVTLHASA